MTPTIQGDGPKVRIVRWLNEHPPPYGWEASELMWARLEMPMWRMLHPDARWPPGLRWLQVASRRSELLELFNACERELRELPRFSAQPHRGRPA